MKQAFEGETDFALRVFPVVGLFVVCFAPPAHAITHAPDGH